MEQRTDYGKYKTGYIGFQDHGSNLSFRNVKIKNFKPISSMKKRDFLKTSLAAASTAFIPKSVFTMGKKVNKLRTAHIGVGGMGGADLKSIASHPDIEVAGLGDVDSCYC